MKLAKLFSGTGWIITLFWVIFFAGFWEMRGISSDSFIYWFNIGITVLAVVFVSALSIKFKEYLSKILTLVPTRDNNRNIEKDDKAKENDSSESKNIIIKLSLNKFYMVVDELYKNKYFAERRGVKNLQIGIVVAVVGILVAVTRILTLDVNSVETGLLALIPSLLFSLMIELLAFFFLRLYSKSLEESKYYANEINILETRFLGYFLAAAHGDDAERKAIIADFGKYIRELPTLRSTPVIDKATTGALIDLVKSVVETSKGGGKGG